jgi:hypothetical protein
LRDEFEDGSNIMGMKKTGRQWPETFGNGGKLYWEPISVEDCSA